ncbi:MAG TPA: phosphotransferase [Polyangiaceae bacterium]|nr:phosphotransferase [Polyangiaceae bacterium]
MASSQLLEILHRALPGGRVLTTQDLAGGVSARAVRVNVLLTGAGDAKQFVVRRPSAANRSDASRIAEREYRLLSFLWTNRVRVPRPVALDLEAAAVVLEYVPGSPDFVFPANGASLSEMADQLAAIHRLPIDALQFLPRREQTIEQQLSETDRELDRSLGEATVRTALETWWPRHDTGPQSLLHGDYWPGNLLWNAGELSAVLDWEEAEIGNPLADLAVTRLDLWWAFGADAAGIFTARYAETSHIDPRQLAIWDLCAALRPMSNLELWASCYAHPPISRPDVTLEHMRTVHARFVAQALAALGD